MYLFPLWKKWVVVTTGVVGLVVMGSFLSVWEMEVPYSIPAIESARKITLCSLNAHLPIFCSRKKHTHTHTQTKSGCRLHLLFISNIYIYIYIYSLGVVVTNNVTQHCVLSINSHLQLWKHNVFYPYSFMFFLFLPKIIFF